MPIIVRPAGDTDLSNATITAETSLPQVIAGLAPDDYEVGRVEWAAPVTVTAVAATFTGIVVYFGAGQSNLNSVNNLVTDAFPQNLQGRFDRSEIFNKAWINDNSQDLTIVHEVAEPGFTTPDGVVGPVYETEAGSGVSHFHGVALQIADTPGTGSLSTAEKLVYFKNGNNGTDQDTWAPGGGGWGTSDFMIRNGLPVLVSQQEVRIWGFAYAQGEADAKKASDDIQAAQGSTDPAIVVPLAIQEAGITEWAANQSNTRRANREYFPTIPNLPYVILGVVLTNPDVEPYANNAERVREALTTQYRNLARYEVTLNQAGTAIDIVDLGLNLRTIAYDTATDRFTETVTGTPAPHKDSATYLINAREYQSNDSLHHSSNAQVLIGTAKDFLMKDIYGGDGTPPASHAVTGSAAVFDTPVALNVATDTTASFTFGASEASTCHVAAYAAGSAVPTAAQVIDGTGAVSSVSASCVRRQTSSGSLAGLTAETSYDVYSVLVFGSIVGGVTGPLEVTTTAAATGGEGGAYFIGSTPATVPQQDAPNEVQTVTLTETRQTGDLTFFLEGADVAADGIGSTAPGTTISGAGYSVLLERTTGNPGFQLTSEIAGATPTTTVDVPRMDGKGKAFTSFTLRVGALEAGPLEGGPSNTNVPDPDPLTSLTAGAISVVAMVLDDDNYTGANVTAPAGYENLRVVNAGDGEGEGSQGTTIAFATRVLGAPGVVDPGPFTVNGVGDIASSIHIIYAAS